ncbi:RNA polymerase II-associated factor 1 homolog [Artemia franciscana]|uniref:RNA polymerase II-associated factor 1 homolog n=1 Tax=Artemia franciscana TaxID=6661 RepID=UPI0032DBD714
MTIQSSRSKQVEKRTDIVCRVKYSNNLPDIPFDLKFISYPFASNRFIKYKQTSLERSYKYDVLAEHDLGVAIDLVTNNPNIVTDTNAKLDPADERLFEEDSIHTPQDSKRSAQHRKTVSWLRRTEYISTEATRFQPTTAIEKAEAKVGYNVKKSLKEDLLYSDKESQIKAIEKTFEDAKVPIERHHNKAGVYPVEILPALPDYELWKYPCAQVIFDADPAPANMSASHQMEEMSQAMIRGVMDETGEQFVAYFLPTEETMEKRRNDLLEGVDYKDDEEYEYVMTRQYHWNVKSKASKGYEENYFFLFRDNGVYYNELETRVRLTKRRPKAGAPPVSNTRLLVKHRPSTRKEDKLLRIRERNLEPPGNYEEESSTSEEEEEEDEEEEKKESGSEAGSARSRSSSRSRSRSKSASRSRSRSRSVSSAASAASKRSKSKSRSRSRSKSSIRSRSRSATPAGSTKERSPSRSKSRSKSPSRSRSRSRSSGVSKSPSPSRSRSQSRGPSKSPTRSPSGSRSASAASSRTGSPEKSSASSGSESD